jgi:outer membrane protein OmpA-like peptidoglycan-associated protein
MAGGAELHRVGHTDSVGSERFNQRLGLARAKGVCSALRKSGVRGKIVVKSAGESRPRAANSTARGRALNRRVEITVRYR